MKNNLIIYHSIFKMKKIYPIAKTLQFHKHGSKTLLVLKKYTAVYVSNMEKLLIFKYSKFIGLDYDKENIKFMKKEKVK